MGWSRPHESERADYDRDNLRDAPDYPGGDFEEPGKPEHRLTLPIATALEIAVLVKGMADVRACAGLIEQYAQTVASAARLEGATDAYNHIDKVLTEAGR